MSGCVTLVEITDMSVYLEQLLRVKKRLCVVLERSGLRAVENS